MRLALFGGREGKSRWLKLPALCCEAAGGEPGWADHLTAAWVMYYAAAHLMDSVQDQDEPDSWWAEKGAGAALSAATGLYFSASLALNQLHQQEATCQAAADISESFFKGFMVLSSGQQRDIERPEPGLEEYWELAQAKSGIFFSLACRNGARLAMDDPVKLDEYKEFGQQLGVIIQVLDDLDDVITATDDPSDQLPAQIRHALPYVYARSVLPHHESEKLRQCAHQMGGETGKAEALELIDRSGAAMFTLAAVDERKRRALEALRRTQAKSAPRDALEELLQSL